MSEYGFTEFGIFCMFIYGFIALISDSLIFDWKISGGIVLFVFIIEYIIEEI